MSRLFFFKLVIVDFSYCTIQWNIGLKRELKEMYETGAMQDGLKNH